MFNVYIGMYSMYVTLSIVCAAELNQRERPVVSRTENKVEGTEGTEWTE